ncbi:carbonic anhydrase-related protein-like [Limulus polyphemus]|uniref:Carbonic anhydrase-related protein-like n=1 Tax=Limulus polyphemus TaxID=6850 RepID=A0ABM1T1U3_LIMPO|nr:carbonic anhydrase-related protein-like [Limulus polyphemus]
MYFSFEEEKTVDKIYGNDEDIESLIYDEEDTRCDTGFCQSPVNLISRDAVYRPLDIHKPFDFRYTECRECVLQNTGSAARVIFQHPTGSSNDSQSSYKSYIIGGPLLNDTRYKLSEMYFHWGKDDTVGSEHTVNNTAFPMEIQLIHWNSTYYHCADEAAKGENGLVIVTIFVQVGRMHEELETLIDNFWAIQYKGQSKVIGTTFNPSCLLPHPSLRDYWTYSGSLTWPPFSENVEWILLRYPLTVSHQQLYEFRRLKKHVKHDLTVETRHEDFLNNNFRPLQPLNGRTIWASFES